MKSSTLKPFSLVLLLLLSVAAFSVCNRTPPGRKPLRLGWQPPWANQGQIVEVFKNSDVLSRNDVPVEFKAFTYGGPMTEAALAGELDILFAGDQPGITLISRDSDWRIVARNGQLSFGVTCTPRFSTEGLKRSSRTKDCHCLRFNHPPRYRSTTYTEWSRCREGCHYGESGPSRTRRPNCARRGAKMGRCRRYRNLRSNDCRFASGESGESP